LAAQLEHLIWYLVTRIIFISAFNGRAETIEQLDKIGLAEIALSAFTVMELFQGMGNKNELA
jgi:hypothetical protein